MSIKFNRSIAYLVFALPPCYIISCFSPQFLPFLIFFPFVLLLALSFLLYCYLCHPLSSSPFPLFILSFPHISFPVFLLALFSTVVLFSFAIPCLLRRFLCYSPPSHPLLPVVLLSLQSLVFFTVSSVGGPLISSSFFPCLPPRPLLSCSIILIATHCLLRRFLCSTSLFPHLSFHVFLLLTLFSLL